MIIQIHNFCSMVQLQAIHFVFFQYSPLYTVLRVPLKNTNVVH